MCMRLEQTPKPDHVLRVSTRLITSSTILHLSADELERTVNQEQTENPALEVAESRPSGGSRILGGPMEVRRGWPDGWLWRPAKTDQRSKNDPISDGGSPQNPF